MEKRMEWGEDFLIGGEIPRKTKRARMGKRNVREAIARTQSWDVGTITDDLMRYYREIVEKKHPRLQDEDRKNEIIDSMMLWDGLKTSKDIEKLITQEKVTEREVLMRL